MYFFNSIDINASLANVKRHLWSPQEIIMIFSMVSALLFHLLTVLSDRIGRTFNRYGTATAVALEIYKALDRVWYTGLISVYNGFLFFSFLVIPCLVVVFQSCLEWIPIKNYWWLDRQKPWENKIYARKLFYLPVIRRGILTRAS